MVIYRYFFILFLVATDDDKKSFEKLYGLSPKQLNMFISRQKYAAKQPVSVTGVYFLYLLLHFCSNFNYSKYIEEVQLLFCLVTFF